jgi:hypothetical protein
MSIAEIRAQIEEALMAYAALDSDIGGDRMTLGWVLAYEFTTAELEERNESACGVVTAADSQARSTSRGVLELAVDRFRI